MLSKENNKLVWLAAILVVACVGMKLVGGILTPKTGGDVKATPEPTVEPSATPESSPETTSGEKYGFATPAPATEEEKKEINEAGVTPIPEEEAVKVTDDSQNEKFLYADGYEYDTAQKACYQKQLKSPQSHTSCDVLYDENGEEIGVEFKYVEE